MSRFRIASVSFVNARPLIYGLDRHRDVELELAVPSALLGMLERHEADVALLPTIDFQRTEDLIVLPAGGIASDGPTLTVRIFSRVPITQVRSLACDPDSHTSIALARIILQRRHGQYVELCELSRATDAADQARLLIGDKVVCEEPAGFPYQLDLGQEWKALTGLPFVFAAWMARPHTDLETLNQLLLEAKQRGKSRIEEIVTNHAIPRGWPVGLARQYLTQNLQFDIGPREIEAIERFHRMSADVGMIERSGELKIFA